MFAAPAPLAADADVVDRLKPEPFLANRDGHPQRALVMLEPVAGEPGRPLRKLHAVHDHEKVGVRRFEKVARVRCEIRTASGQNHEVLSLPAAAAGSYR
jgi:hypothetical protein